MDPSVLGIDEGASQQEVIQAVNDMGDPNRIISDDEGGQVTVQDIIDSAFDPWASGDWDTDP